VEECLAGDEAAWERFTRRLASAARSAAEKALRTACGSAQAADVDDAVQAAFSGLLADDCASLRRFEWKCSLATYVSVLASRAAFDIVRRRPSREAPVDPEHLAEVLPDGRPGPVEAASRAELRARALAAISTLPAGPALSARLYYMDGWSAKEIARFRRVPYNTAVSDLHRARELLRSKLAGVDREPRP